MSFFLSGYVEGKLSSTIASNFNYGILLCCLIFFYYVLISISYSLQFCNPKWKHMFWSMFTSPNQFLFWVMICLLVGLLIPGTVTGEC